MNQQQWQIVESIVRKEQAQALQRMNTSRYEELKSILDHLHTLAHN